MLRCVILCYVVLYYNVMLCCILLLRCVLCDAVLFFLRGVMFCYIVLFYGALCYDVLCNVVLCYAVLCHFVQKVYTFYVIKRSVYALILFVCLFLPPSRERLTNCLK